MMPESSACSKHCPVTMDLGRTGASVKPPVDQWTRTELPVSVVSMGALEVRCGREGGEGGGRSGGRRVGGARGAEECREALAT